MKYVIIKPKSQEEKKLFNRIEESIKKLYQKLSSTDFAEIGLSAYNQRYLKEYLNNYTFFARFYSQVFIAALRELHRPVEESVFVDYGGGSGFFSFLAKETGFGKVLYIDIYDVSVSDAKLLAKVTGIAVDQFVLGDIDGLVVELNKQKISPDLICSFEVIEHIYNLDDWFLSAQKIEGKFSLVFSSSANIKNPYISGRLKKAQRKAELEGTKKEWGSKERDAAQSFLKIRKEIIAEQFSKLEKIEIHRLAVLTRGFNREDIIKSVSAFMESGKEIVPVSHPTNTCDPLTGNWSEHLINHKWLKRIIEKNGFENISIKPGLYTYSNNKLAFFVKKILNLLIWVCGRKGLMFSPIYILKASKKN